MPHTMVTFRLHRSGVILLIVFAVIIGACLYAAGYLTAVYRSGSGGAAAASAAEKKPGGRSGRPSTSTKKAAPPAEPQESLTLRVGVHTTEEDAKAQAASLTAAGLQPAIVQMPTSSGVTLHSVCVGHYTTRSAANAAAKELQSRLGIPPAIVPAKRL